MNGTPFLPPPRQEQQHQQRQEQGGERHAPLTPSQREAREGAAQALRRAERQAERLALAEKEEYLKTRKWRESALFGAGPETMTSDDYETIHDVRRNIWTGGFSGFAAGLFAAAVGSLAYPVLQRRGGLGPLAKAMEPRHRTAALLISAALGMAVGASTAGQNNSWRMTNIYSRGAQPVLTPYQATREGGDGAGGAGGAGGTGGAEGAGGGRWGGRRVGEGGNGDNEDLDSDQRLREWGWDPVKNEPSVAPATMVRRSAENTDRRFADTLDGSPADAPFGTAQPRRHF